MAAALNATTVAHFDPRGHVIYQAEGAAPRVAATSGYDVRLTPNGRQLTLARLERDMPRRTLVLWDAATGGSRNLWIMPVAEPAKAARVSTRRLTSLCAWTATDAAVEEKSLEW